MIDLKAVFHGGFTLIIGLLDHEPKNLELDLKFSVKIYL